MALTGRPLKQDADWFRHDKDMRNDPKVRALRRKFGLPGYAIYCMMIETLTDSAGFTTVENPIQTELSTGDFGIDSEPFKEIMDYCVTVGLFQREPNPSGDGTILSSRRLKCDMQALIDARNSDREYIRRRKDTEQSRAEHITAEQSTEEQSSSLKTATPPAAASFPSLLKNTLATAGILLSPSDFDVCASKMIASSVDCPAFLDFAIDKCRRAKQRGTWFVKGVIEWDWIGKWRAAGDGSSVTSSPKQMYHTPTTDEMKEELAASTPEEESAAALKAAQFKADHHMPLSDQERELLGLPTPPSVEQAIDDFEDDFPEEAAT